ncbi:MAG: hypothetical protein HY696_01450 [Deltaproteobacteria bacterium]|nr:hypothetical protein [Deltaproteobacteria bacterium]
MNGIGNHYRERMIATLIARQSGAVALHDYAPAVETVALQERVAALQALPDSEREAAIDEQLQTLRTAQELVLLGEIHPSWLVDILLHESPRVIGLILRFLPSRHTRYVLEHLPTALREQLPSVVDAFAVSDVVLKIIRHRFESHFAPARLASQVEELSIQTLHGLNLVELETLIRDLGVDELAMAFGHMSTAALRMLLNRLPFVEAKALKSRIAELRGLDQRQEQEARYTVLEVPLERKDPEGLISEVGILALAKAFSPRELPSLPIIKQKLPPRLAYLLQRDVDTHVLAAHSAITEARQARVLRRIGVLARQQLIDAAWLERLPEVYRRPPAVGEETAILVPRGGDESDLLEEAL